jgi:hypothetical protein
MSKRVEVKVTDEPKKITILRASREESEMTTAKKEKARTEDDFLPYPDEIDSWVHFPSEIDRFCAQIKTHITEYKTTPETIDEIAPLIDDFIEENMSTQDGEAEGPIRAVAKLLVLYDHWLSRAHGAAYKA